VPRTPRPPRPLQADELLRYLSRSKAEAEREAYVSDFSLEGDRPAVVQRLVGEVKDLGNGTDKGSSSLAVCSSMARAEPRWSGLLTGGYLFAPLACSLRLYVCR